MARDALRKALEKGCDPVPCPACGWYQRDMVKKAGQRKYMWLHVVSAVLFMIGVLFSLPVVGVAFAGESPPPPDFFVFLWIWGSTLAAFTFCLVLGFLLPWTFDPNKGDMETRRRVDSQIREWIRKDAGFYGIEPTSGNLLQP
jgi:hypothetical protein